MLDFANHMALVFGIWLIFINLQKNNIRYDKYIFVLAVAFYAIGWYLIDIRNGTIIEYILMSLYIMILPLVFCKREIVNSYNQYFFILLVMNVFPNLFIAIMGIFYGLINDGNATWFNADKLTFKDEVILLIINIITIFCTWIIINKCKKAIMNLHGFFKYIVFFMGPMLSFLNSFMKTFYNSYSDVLYQTFPTGLIFVIDAFLLIMGLCFLIIIFIKICVEQKKENKAIEDKINTDNERYKEIMNLQLQLRKLNHDLKNYIISGNEDVVNEINESTEKILRNIEG